TTKRIGKSILEKTLTRWPVFVDHFIGKIKNHILKMPLPGSVVASVSPDDLLKTLPKRKG
ncbi:hypothetical protein POW65_01865, partial [Escherichia coli]